MSTIRPVSGSFRARPLAIAIAAALAAPLANAEPMLTIPLYGGAYSLVRPDMSRYDENNVELGAGYNSEDSFKFGEWSGLRKDGAFLIANAYGLKRSEADNRNYFQFYGWNLGLPSRQMGLAGGRQGVFNLYASYDMLTHYQTESARFFYDGLGSNNLTLPAGFAGITAGASQPPNNAAAINAQLKQYDIEQTRDILKLGGNVRFLGPFELVVNYRNDDRGGNVVGGALMGYNGGNPRSVLVPVPQDDSTNQVEAILRWTTEKAQVQASYWWSGYDNNNTALNWQNAYGNVAGWAGAVGVGSPAAMGLAPKNQFQQFNVTGGYNFTPSTRLTGTLSYSVATQNESFLPYTVNGLLTPAGVATTAVLPFSSLNGRVENTLADVGFFTRITPKWPLRINYEYRDSTNKSSAPTQGPPFGGYFNYIGGDSCNQNQFTLTPPAGTCGADKIRRNLPPGATEQKILVDSDYAIAPRTILRGFYWYRTVDYKPAADELRTDTATNNVSVELRRIMNEDFTGAVRYAYEWRRGSDFSQLRPFQGSYWQPFVNQQRYDTLPTTRQFLFSDYDQNKLRLFGNITPVETVAVQLAGDWSQTIYKGPDCGGPTDQAQQNPGSPRFPNECQGRNNALGQSYTADVQWTPAESITTFAFYTWSQFKTAQASRTWAGANFVQAADANRDWAVNLDYTDNTVGLGLRYAPGDRRWDVGAQYLYNTSRGESNISAQNSSAANGTLFSPVPALKTTLNSLQLFAKYTYSKSLTFRFNYWYERLRTDDWAYDNLTPTSSNNVVLTGQSSPNYSANVFGVSVAYTNW